MRIILIGQAAFGKDVLEALLKQGETIVGVITKPDRSAKVNPVKALADEKAIPVLQPAKLRDPETLKWVRHLAPDLLVLAYVTDIVPKEMIDLSTHGGINYHPSLLPKFRGGSAMNWAIISGETETGVTIHMIDEGIDTGPIILQEKVAIEPEDTLKSLYFNKLYPLGIKMIPEAVRLIREGRANPVPQNESEASYQPLIKEKDVVIEWSRPTQAIYNLIRGSNPSPGATTRFGGEKLKIWEATPSAATGEPAEIIALDPNRGFVVCTGDGAILVQRVQYRDTGKIPAYEFISKFSVKIGNRLGA
ncbi:MAG: methionyl-tRNA formyltransferase [Deltaproteobacteria bacterium]|nr:methionyl-tRNA formyltransferase [Deltaproteobacteria bacterium]